MHSQVHRSDTASTPGWVNTEQESTLHPGFLGLYYPMQLMKGSVYLHALAGGHKQRGGREKIMTAIVRPVAIHVPNAGFMSFAEWKHE